MAEDVNISPEMINNLVNMLKNNSNSDNNNAAERNNKSENNQANNINLGDILSKMSSDSSDNASQNSSASNSSIDFETIMKMKSIMETLNSKNDSKSNLLYSLKPYLRKSKQAKLDQYVNLMKISQVTNLFKTEKGDTK